MKQEIIELVEQAKNNKESAFTKLYNEYYNTVWFTIYNIVKNKDVTEDLISVVFTKAFQKLDLYTEHISFEMWLKTIAVNSSIDYIRRMKNEKLNNYIDDEESNVQITRIEKSPEEKLILQENIELLEKILPTLKKRYRDLITAKLEGKSYKDLSEQFALSEDKVKADLHKARKQLRNKFELLTNS